MVSLLFCIVPMHSLVLWNALRKEIFRTVYGGLSFKRKEIKDVLLFAFGSNPKMKSINACNYPQEVEIRQLKNCSGCNH
jgi:hypothetical protein